MKLIKQLGVFILLFSSLVQADPLLTDQSTLRLADQMMDKVMKQKFQDAVDLVKPYYPLAHVELDAFANNLVEKQPQTDQRYGKVLKVEFIKSEIIGDSFIRHIYLQKYENHAQAWQVKFYRSKKEWSFNGADFTEDFDFLFTESK